MRQGYIINQIIERKGERNLKKHSGSFNIRTTPEIHQTLAEIAKTKNVSLKKLIVAIFNNFIDNSENKNGKLYSHLSKICLKLNFFKFRTIES